MKKIMFICTGNICRSAMAHRMFEKMIEHANKPIEIYSCGTFAENGDKPTMEAINVMLGYGIDLKTHRATNIRYSAIQDMDTILCATKGHKKYVADMYPELKDRIYTMKEYAGYGKDDMDIDDPWGYTSEVYEKCAKDIEKCLEKIIDKL